ncbi:MAG: M20/M25/M40 family metallo-hydrolase [Planctomycetota bacterium]
MANVQSALEWLESNEDAAFQRLCDWLRIPSVSTDPEFNAETRRAAEWAKDHLEASGLDVRLVETGAPDAPGHPIVLAESPGSGDGPHILFYGHYDVQPPDPIEGWRTGPFDPVIESVEGTSDRKVVARGACDDKGQVASFLEALRAWKEAGAEPAGGVRFTVLLEGEEESGSVNLEHFLETHAQNLSKCDVCVISDTAMLAPGRPAITYGVRGIAYTEVTLHASDQDLHSGSWGGKVPNPISELTKVLSKLWDGDRKIQIPGFYAAVREIEPVERTNWENLGVDAAASLRGIGLGPEANVGEAGYSFLEREWGRPTAEINGIWGGYTGAGAKTVIPTHASAKVSFRLVADQDPDDIRDKFFAWLESNTPEGCRWETTDLHGGPPATVSTDSEMLSTAASAIEKAAGVKPELIKTGGSIPVAGLLKSRLGLETIFMGFGLETDRVHSPNEEFRLSCFSLGARSHIMFIDALRG